MRASGGEGPLWDRARLARTSAHGHIAVSQDALLQDLRPTPAHPAPRAARVRGPVPPAQEDHQPDRRRAHFPRSVTPLTPLRSSHALLPGLSPDVLQAVIQSPPGTDGKGKQREDASPDLSPSPLAHPGPRVVYELANTEDHVEPRLRLYLDPQDAPSTPQSPSSPTLALTIPLSVSPHVLRLPLASLSHPSNPHADRPLDDP